MTTPTFDGKIATALAVRLRSPRRVWRLLPLPPIVVIVMGLAIAAVVGRFGLSNLATASDEHAAARAELIASVLGARLSQLPQRERLEMMQYAARKTGADLVIASRTG